MRIPHTRSTDTMQQVIRTRSNEYTVERQTGTKDIGMGETTETTELLYVCALLYAPSESSDMFEFGDRLTGDLNGLALADADIQVGDEYEHGQHTYEVTTVDNAPSNIDAQIQRFALDRVTTDRQ